MSVRRIAPALAVAAACAALWSGIVTASAHALAQSSTPADGAALQSPPPQVVITFGEPPDPGISTISVIDTRGVSWTSGPTVPAPGNPLQLQVPLRALPHGVYTVTWKTVSAVDGHLAAGSFAFGVGVSPGTRPATVSAVSAALPGPLSVVARLLLYAGLVVVLGTLLLALSALGAIPASLRRLAACGAALAWIGATAVAAVQLTGAGVSLGAALGSSLGRSSLAREAAGLALLGAALTLLRAVQPRLPALLTGALAVASMLIDVLYSHAAAQQPATLNEVAQLLHILAVGAWIGGLAALLTVLLRADQDDRPHLARRLSTVAGGGLLLVAATGVFRAVVEVQAWGNLVTTAFGLLVIVKSVLIVCLASLGALNRFGHLPHLPAMLRRLRRTVSAELVIGVAAITAAAMLVNVAPPVSFATAAAQGQTQPLLVTGSDFGTTVRARLSVSPGVAGTDDFSIFLSDYDSGSPVEAQGVSITFTLPNQSIVGSSRLAFKRAAPGEYRARGGNLAVDGTWSLTVTVQRGPQSVEIPMRLTTRSVPPHVTRTAFAGAPTLYTVQLSQGGFVQVYIDPDHAGPVEFHMTFLDAKQNEVPISDAAAVELISGSPQNLAVRRLDQIGHFVADATVPRGVTRFQMIATTMGGNILSTYVDVTPAS